MADLVSTSAFIAYLGNPDEVDTVVAETLLTQTQQLLEMQAGRSDRPFQLPQAGRTERHDGTGTRTLLLDYRVATLTSVILGFDVLVPDETLDIADQKSLVWTAGSDALRRVDGRCFGAFGQPGYVHVTYDTQEDLPESAALAVLRVAAALYLQRGNEDIRMRREGGVTAEITPVAESDPVWQSVVRAHRVPVVS